MFQGKICLIFFACHAAGMVASGMATAVATTVVTLVIASSLKTQGMGINKETKKQHQIWTFVQNRKGQECSIL